MASWNARHRDPLLDNSLQEVLRQRGKEMIGLALIGIGAAIALMLASYSPGDPGWMAVSDAPVANALGRFGATVASPLMIIAGMGSWGLVAGFVGWGLRFVLHQGGDLFLSRAIFLPIVIALSAVWAATLVPGPGWDQMFGMGGVFGDTVLGAIVTALPMAPGPAVNLMSVLLMLALVLAWAFVLGVVRREALAFGRWLVIGAVLTYAGLVRALGFLGTQGARAGSAAAGVAAGAVSRRVRDRAAQPGAATAPHGAADYPDRDEDSMIEEPMQERPHRRAEPMLAAQPAVGRAARSAPPILRANPAGHPAVSPSARPGPWADAQNWSDEDHPAAPWPALGPRAEATGPAAEASDARQGLLARLKRLSLRPDAPVAPVPASQGEPSATPAPHDPGGVSGEDRIRARITDAIKARSRSGNALRLGRTEPPVQRPVQPPAAARVSVPGASRIPPTPAPRAPVPPAPVPPAAAAPRLEVAQGAAPASLSPTEITGAGWFGLQAPFGFDLSPGRTPAPATHAPAQAPLIAEPLFDPEQPEPAPPPGGHVLHRRVLQAGARPIAPSTRAQAEAQPALAFDAPGAAFDLPPLSLLASPDDVQRYSLSDEALEENARMLENVLDDYGVRGEIVSVRPGPVVTMYELEPAPGLKASRVIGLADDIARSMSALSARVSTVPGRSVIGIELPNAHREKVVLREILAARDFGDTQMRLPLALGKDIGGAPVVANLAKMPHLLIAGTTGSGKSVAINTMILSLLYKLTPDECRLIMIDPKMLELSVYDGIPHLLSPVVTDPKKAVVALKWVVAEMEERYRKMSKMGVRNIEGFNGRVHEALDRGEMFKRTVQTGFDDETGDPVFESEEFAPEALPYIVVIVDEMADLMMVAGKEIEACIQRLAQMARASGIHLIMATQRPSVDVITGTIKANFPTRISFQVTSKIDSRTILGEQGAEQLLGMGDMLYMAGGARITRVHGPFVSDEEVEEIVNHLKSFGPPDYVGGVVEGPDSEKEADIDAVLGLGGNTDGEDALYDQAVQVVIKDRKCSTSYIQRKLGIGYNKAARLVEQMEDEGLVTPANHVGKREILVPEQG
ncbi:MAG: DNA translocase FtsK 4TM domain-containing protein [Rhodobacteraceae bacterium]|nr:DNA translocase FtsK 4TM domain-containing protein [Paracoccaceae bacterium]